MDAICLSCGDRFKSPNAKQLTCSRACGTRFQAAYRQARAHAFFMRAVGSDGCAEWPWEKQSRGYGVFSAMSQRQLAHRMSYEFMFGAIPDGLNVLHRCDNPICVRPDHLYAGTQSQNMCDRWARTGRSK